MFLYSTPGEQNNGYTPLKSVNRATAVELIRA